MGTVNPPARSERIRAEQIRLLYAHTTLSFFVTVLASAVLSFLERQTTPLPVLAGWLLYMLVVAAFRFTLGLRYRAVAPDDAVVTKWCYFFTVGAALAGIGWGAAAILLYPRDHIVNQVFLAFILGGMMLGAGSLLASRPEAFLAFLIPTGIPIAIRFVLQGDVVRMAMGLLAAVFTGATLVTTWRIHKTIADSLSLRFENETLVADLRLAKAETEVLNQQLEDRVRERTAELYDANDRLRAEMEQRVRIEEELLRARKLESLGVLAGGIAHDFNNFLTILQGNLGLAKSRLEPDTPVSGLLDEAASACERAASLAQQLLTFGKGGAPVRRVVSVNRLLQDTVSLASAGAQTTIHLEVAGDLWPAEIDPSQISHTLCNILVNARQAMMPEPGEIQIEAENFIAGPGATSLPAGKYLKIAVRDHGCGIAPENLSRVFDPYFTTKSAGSGLGLATAHAIVAKHQGLITVESTLGVETTFTVFLPASDRPPESEEPPAGLLQRGKGKILVMDDEDAIRRLLAEMLERLGYVVECARDGSEAIARYQQAKARGDRFDVVLLDLTVPGGMGGLEATGKLKEIDPSPKFIVSSGYSDAPVISEFQKYGFDAVLAKPWTPAQVSALLSRVIGSPDSS